ncbi:MAG: hypothetical protein EON47_13680, partial [Acetobacteraceae bacterium]
ARTDPSAGHGRTRRKTGDAATLDEAGDHRRRSYRLGLRDRPDRGGCRGDHQDGRRRSSVHRQGGVSRNRSAAGDLKMHHTRQAIARTIAEPLIATERAIDEALAQASMMAAAMANGRKAAKLPAMLGQDVFESLGSAMQALFKASGGGGLGLFTAIRRLRDSFRHMAPNLEAAGIPLYAQHMDAMDNATLVDVFRAEENSCLLGTDAMRDGVDVPGRSLRLLVFDRVPWPRPSILHRERRIHLSAGDPKGYDDALARHRLRQAFGRLIRRVDDKGVFVLLDRSCPSRLLAGLPEGVSVRRTGLAEVVAETRAFLAEG